MKWDGKSKTDDVHSALEQLNVMPVKMMIKNGNTVKEIAEYLESVFKKYGFKTIPEKKIGIDTENNHYNLYFRDDVPNNTVDNVIFLTWNQCAKELMKMNGIETDKEEEIKWDEISDIDAISQALMRFITAEERQKALKMSYGDLTGIIRQAHMHDVLVFDEFEVKGYFDRVTVYIKSQDKLYKMTWNKAAKAINRYVNGEKAAEQENKEDMAGIDFKALKNARKAIEDKVEDNIPEELESTYTSVWGGNKENVIQIEVTRLVPFTDSEGNTQPYKLNEKKIEQIKASAEDIGIVEPLRVRQKGDIYEIISGHHRLEAARQLGHLTVPCLVGKYDDETAYKVLSECNIQREKILPSEYGKIFARYMKLREENEELTVEEIAKKFNVSKKTIYRYTALNSLNERVQELADKGTINVMAVECLKDLDTDEQNALCDVLDKKGMKLSVPLAKRVKKLTDEEYAGYEEIEEVLTKTESKPVYQNKIYSSLSSKFNITMKESDLDDLTAKLLEEYFSKKSEKD